MDAPGDLETVWEEHQAMLWRVAWLIVQDADVADDVVSTAIVRASAGWKRRSVEDPKAYLRRAVVNAATDHFRARGLDRRWAPRRTGEGRGQRSVEDAAADATAIAQALATLPVGQRAVVVLRYWADLTEVETAAALDISVGTVKSRASRALRALAVQLEPAHP